MLAAAFLFTVSHAIIKILGERLHPFQIVFFRSALGVIFILPFVWRQAGWRVLQTGRPGIQIIRGLAGAGAMMGNFYALAYLPLADATTISFSRALFVVPLAMIILSERVGWMRIITTLVGFAGVMIALRPGGTLDPAALVALGASACLALGVTLVRLLSRTDGPLTLLLYGGISGVIVSVVPAIFVWRMPTWGEGVLILMIGLLSVIAHNCFVRAHGMAEATMLAPLDYTRLVFATGLGFILFAAVPDIWTLAGALIIMGATLLGPALSSRNRTD